MDLFSVRCWLPLMMDDEICFDTLSFALSDARLRKYPGVGVVENNDSENYEYKLSP